MWSTLIKEEVCAEPYILGTKYFKGEIFRGFQGFMSNLENFNLDNSILCFCNPQNIYHKSIESHESMNQKF